MKSWWFHSILFSRFSSFTHVHIHKEHAAFPEMAVVVLQVGLPHRGASALSRSIEAK